MRLFLHKFRVVNDRLLSSLTNSQVFFSATEALNDPFDCMIKFREAFSEAHETPLAAVNTLENEGTLSLVLEDAKKRGVLCDGDHFSKTLALLFRDQPSWSGFRADQVFTYLETAISSVVSSIGVLCFSTRDTPYKPLMWSHYANEHRGVCLTYELLEDSFPDQCVVAHGAMQYNDNDLLDAIKAYKAHKKPTLEDFTSIMMALVSTKSPDWNYEEEYRLITASFGLHDISRKSLRAVCFGLRASQEDRLKIREVVSESGYNCVFTEAVRSGVYRLDIRPA
jgi:hypothetical protein